ncbi:MAG: hypothetical protein K1X65_09365 [Caldilineales bacterium]|nr:hypothetical protein [Caldilineales bacterium]
MRNRTHRFLVAFALLFIAICLLPALALAQGEQPPGEAIPPIGDIQPDVELLPVQISLNPTAYPGLGQPTTVVATLLAVADMANVIADLELPAGATLIDGQTQWSGSLRAAEPTTFSATIVFNQVGNWGVRGRVLATESADVSYSNVSYAYFNVDPEIGAAGLDKVGGDSRRTSVEQLEAGDASLVTDEATAQQAESEGDEVMVAPEPQALDLNAQPDLSAQASEGTLVVTGRWMYYNRAGSLVALPNILMQLVRGDNNSHLAWAYTDWSGNFTFPGVSNPGSAGVKVRARAYTKWSPNNFELMMVRIGGSVWTDAYWGETTRYVFSDGTRSVGTWNFTRPSSDARNKAYWGIVDLDTAFLYPPNQPGGSIVEWAPTENSGCTACYYPGGHIHLRGGQLDDVATVIVHEYGHNVMNNAYASFPTNDCVSPHYIDKIGGTNCGWTEGWADFFALAVLNDTSFRWPGGANLNLATPSWFTSGWDNGERVEGRVAGTLLDIMDSTSDGYDRYSDGFSRIWATFFNQDDNTFSQFWSAWQGRGYDLRIFRAAAFQNTIDYGYKPKLTLTWGAAPADLDSHLWLPSSNPSHVYYSARGSQTAFPWANLDVDDANGYGPENIVIARPYNGVYKVGVYRFSPSGNIAGTGAVMRYYLGSYLVNTWTVPGSGTGGWWYVADLDGFTGVATTKNLVQSSSPAPYTVAAEDAEELQSVGK